MAIELVKPVGYNSHDPSRASLPAAERAGVSDHLPRRVALRPAHSKMGLQRESYIKESYIKESYIRGSLTSYIRGSNTFG